MLLSIRFAVGVLVAFFVASTTSGFVIVPATTIRSKSTVCVSLPATPLLDAVATSSLSLADAAAVTTNDELMLYLYQTLISNGIPALFTILVGTVLTIQLTSLLSKSKKEEKDAISSGGLSQLYSDIYGDSKQQQQKKDKMSSFPFGKPSNPKLNENTGVPAQEYLKITDLNRKYRSMAYTITSAVSNKAAAATNYRADAYSDVWTGLASHASLVSHERDYLSSAKKLEASIATLQTKVLAESMQKTFAKLDITNVYDLDMKPTNSSSSSSSSAIAKSSSNAKKELQKCQSEFVDLQNDFYSTVITTLGPAHAGLVQTAVLKSTERPLVTLFGTARRNVFVCNFPGDTQASQLNNLREEITGILQSDDVHEVVLVLQTGGGTVTGYGLAAAQLQRLKDAGITLTICVEQVAASGGYMMACLADTIVASPFAVLGSIGVLSDIPNFYERLQREGIAFQTVTAGKYKRTLTPFKKIAKADVDKTRADVEDIFELFRDYVGANRPQLDLDVVATGETWFGTAALERQLCDEIKTVDEVLLGYVETGARVFEIAYAPPPAPNSLAALLAPVGGVGLVDSIVEVAADRLTEQLSQKLPGVLGVPMLKDDVSEQMKFK